MVTLNLEVPEADIQAKVQAQQEARQYSEALAQRDYALYGGGGVFASLDGDSDAQVLFVDDSYILNRNTLERAPTVAACANTISNLFRSLKLELRPERKSPSKLEQLFNDYPNEVQSAGAFWAELATELVYNGEAIIRVQWGTDGPDRIYVWPADEVTVDYVDQNYLIEAQAPLRYQFHTDSFLFDPDRPQVMHLRLHSDPDHPIRGRSPFWGMTSEVLANIYASQYRREFMRQGGSPRLSLSYKPVLGMPQIDPKQVKEQTQAFTRAVKTSNSYRTTPGIPAEVQDLGPKERQFMELSRYSDERLTSAIGLPLLAINNLERSTYSNARQQIAIMVRDAIGPLINELEACITRDLLIPMRQKRYRAMIDTETLIKDEAAILNKLVLDRYKANVITREEAREQLGYEPELPPTEEEIPEPEPEPEVTDETVQ